MNLGEKPVPRPEQLGLRYAAYMEKEYLKAFALEMTRN
jgi:hypothetical protein